MGCGCGVRDGSLATIGLHQAEVLSVGMLLGVWGSTGCLCVLDLHGLMCALFVCVGCVGVVCENWRVDASIIFCFFLCVLVCACEIPRVFVCVFCVCAECVCVC